LYSIRLGKLLSLSNEIISPDIIHKTDAGGVKLNIKDEKEAKLAYQGIISKVEKYNKAAQICGVMTCSMIPVFVFEKGLQVVDARMIL
jgi:acyl-CoA synthetase (NDP forming)